MFARMLLPKLGGAPAVWNTCIALYQALLLAGYAYAHVLTRRLTLRTQIVVHLALLFAAAPVLPVGVDRAWAPAATENPSLVVGRLLLRSLGLPFFVLSGSGPLLQQWFAWRYGGASNPYRLYAASNGGSLLALLAYAIVAHIIGFLLVALACHMRLAALQPHAARLTEYYLWIAAGGALGGLFNTFSAPVLFVTPIEYPRVAVAHCVLLCDGLTWQRLSGECRPSHFPSIVSS